MKTPGIGKIQGTQTGDLRGPNNVTGGAGPKFDELLQGKLETPKLDPRNLDIGKLEKSGALGNAAPTSNLKFSQHAIERMRSRGISLNGDDMRRLQDAVQRAEAKGSRETLILMKDSAMIVNIKNKTVVTAMDQQMMKENIFTNIDSTVVL